MKKTITELRNGPPPKEFKKFWNILNTSADEGEIILYGEVCSAQPIDWWTGEAIKGLFITPEGFLEDILQLKDKKNITVKLNSVGGDLYTGLAIHNVLKGLSSNIKVIVEGIAASAGSIIACAGDDVQVYPGSIVMIHGVSEGICGWYNLPELRQILSGGEACERAIAEIYSYKTGIAADKLQEMMTTETWMTGSEAIENGFANTLIEGNGPEMSLANNSKTLIVNGIKHDMTGLDLPEKFNIGRKNNSDISKAMTDFMAQMKSIVQGGVTKPATEEISNKSNAKEIEKKGGKTVATTIEELKNESPELVAQIENAAKEAATKSAIEAERKRLKEIEDIEASIGDEELVNAAKYGEKTCSASELALQAMQKQSALGTDHLNNIKKDAENSNTDEINALANGGQDGPAEKSKELENIMDNALKTQFGGKQ